ncbi:GNAT family N-acetyltransferase [Aestuariivivens sp. NBU2969]|uniref:GNAT family N-acetyltransferase n=1 Tax=Aestuariivivens sp. NBU2969 TaxID=2873267 RepID=UPI001CBD1B9D|nr:GNAT family N-acetyltransferase [Aestuariivivens sp. NBU2969]
MVTFNQAKTEHDYQIVAKLADIIWREHYIPMVGKAQIDYMLEKFQSAKVIGEQSNQGYEYYLINFNTTPVGYISIKKEDDSLFLSKIYVLSNHRGKKIGKTALQFVEKKAKASRINNITLTVNKNNYNSILVYEKLGFKNIGPAVKDIGNGFIMDDYKMVKKL